MTQPNAYTDTMTSRELPRVTGPDLTGLHVLDGGLATELERAGCDLASPLWSGDVLRTQPEKVLAVHRSYLEAGADCLLTASYQVSAMGFREVGLPPENAHTAIQQSVALAAQAREEYALAERASGRAPRRIWIAGSLGPYGAALHNGAEFHGNYDVTRAALTEFHAERIAAMQDTVADFLAFETVPSLEEAEAILAALTHYPDVAAYISFTCRDERHTGHGELIRDCARLLDPVDQIIAVGVNCTAPRYIEPLIREIRTATKKRIAVYPNSGETWVAASRSWAGASDPGGFGALAHQWREAGADWIGGCCRTTPQHIRAVATALA
jgi:homocysteine S-methyltransferase